MLRLWILYIPPATFLKYKSSLLFIYDPGLAWPVVYLKQLCTSLHEAVQRRKYPALTELPAFLRMPNPEKEEGKMRRRGGVYTSFSMTYE